MQNTIDKAQNKIGKTVQLKMKTVLEKNTGFKSICTFSKILKDEEVSKLELPEDLNIDDMTYLKFASITSVNVESYHFLHTKLCSPIIADHLYLKIFLVAFSWLKCFFW